MRTSLCQSQQESSKPRTKHKRSTSTPVKPREALLLLYRNKSCFQIKMSPLVRFGSIAWYPSEDALWANIDPKPFRLTRCLPSYLTTYLASYLPMYLSTYLPTCLHSYLASFTTHPWCINPHQATTHPPGLIEGDLQSLHGCRWLETN